MGEERKSKILIIDDEKINIIALAQFFKPKYDVIVALDGPSGLEEAKKQKPDIILLDVLMPDMDGFEVIASLKSMPETERIPVIFITGLDSAADEEKGLRLGAADYISKPFHKAIVERRVRTHLLLAKYLKDDEKLD